MNTQALDKLLAIEKPSDFFTLALDDLEALAKTPGYVIDMDYWISESGGKNCHVCLAGSLLKKELDMDEGNWSRIYNRNNFKNNRETRIVNLADSLNEFRQGYIEDAVNSFYTAKGEDSEVPNEDNYTTWVDIPEYSDDEVGFIQGCRAAIATLREEGL